MFTGIIEAIGTVAAIDKRDNSAIVAIDSPKIAANVKKGDSVCVDGVCLTVTSTTLTSFLADVMPETMKLTTVSVFSFGKKVNLERAMPAEGRFDGHIVQGHVDGLAGLVSREKGEDSEDLRFACGKDIGRFIAKKGSIAINGVSLTVTGVEDNEGTTFFAVSLIPTTLSETTLSRLEINNPVNIEVDVFAKYAERLAQAEGGEK